MVLEAGERIMSDASCAIAIAAYRYGVWRPCTTMQRKGHAWLTNQRLLFSWPHWKGDRGLGSIGERRVYSAAGERDSGAKLILAGHVRHQWITDVFYSRAAGRVQRRSRVSVQAVDHDTPQRVILESLPPDTAQQMAGAFARAIAVTRLATRLPIDHAAAATLRGVAEGAIGAKDLEWGCQFALPAAVKVGFDYPINATR